MTHEEMQIVKALVEIVGQYRERVIKGRITGDLIQGDYEPYKQGLDLIRALSGDHFHLGDIATCSNCGHKIIKHENGRWYGKDGFDDCPNDPVGRSTHTPDTHERVAQRVSIDAKEEREDRRSIAAEAYWKGKTRR